MAEPNDVSSITSSDPPPPTSWRDMWDWLCVKASPFFTPGGLALVFLVPPTTLLLWDIQRGRNDVTLAARTVASAADAVAKDITEDGTWNKMMNNVGKGFNSVAKNASELSTTVNEWLTILGGLIVDTMATLRKATLGKATF